MLTPAWGPRGPKPALRGFMVGAGPSAPAARVPLVLAPTRGPVAPSRRCAASWWARAPARLRRASRLCSRRLGAPWPQVGAARLHGGRGPQRACGARPACARADSGPRGPKSALRGFAAGLLGPRRIRFPGAQTRHGRVCPCGITTTAEPEAGTGDPGSQPFAPILPAGKMVGAGPCAATPRVPLVLTPAWGPRGPKPALRFAGAAPNSLPGGADAPRARLPLRNYDHPGSRPFAPVLPAGKAARPPRTAG